MAFVGLALIVLGATLAGEFGWFTARRPFYLGDEALQVFNLSVAFLCIAVGLVVLLLFFAWARHRKRQGQEPLFDATLFANRPFSCGMTLGFLFQLTVGGMLFVLPVFLQSALQLDSLATALVLLPYTLGIFFFALLASRLPARFAARRIVQLGLLLMFVGGLLVFRSASLELVWAQLIPALACFGGGAGMVLARLSEVTLATIAPAKLGEATGGDSTAKELGVAFGVSVLGSIFLLLVYGNVVDQYDAYHGLGQATSQARQQAIIELEDWAGEISAVQWQAHLDSLPEKTAAAYDTIVDNAYLVGYRTTLQILIAAIAIMLIISTLLPKQSQRE